MKRKFKLFATIASLCLSVALMAFGVYAATNSTYTVTSSVTFTSQVHVKWTGAVAGGKISGETKDTDHETDPTSTADQNYTWNLADALEFGVADEAERTITYTFTCTNLGKDKIKVTAATTKFFGDANLVATAKSGTDIASATEANAVPAEAVELNQNDVYTLVIKVVLQDPSLSIGSDNQLSLVLTAAKA